MSDLLASPTHSERAALIPVAVPAQKAVPAVIMRVQQLLRDDLEQVNAALRAELNSDVPLIGEIGDYLIQAGGKRLRVMLCLLAYRACVWASNSSEHTPQTAATLAAIVEMIHTATLLHDDVVDQSDTRRSRKTANALWGNAPSVLVGDFLYSRAFQMMVRLQSLQVMDVLADTTNTIAEGEVMQLLHKRDADLSQNQYLEVIKRKTAVLFAAATRLGAIAAGADAATQNAMAEFGMQLGIAFQIADDLLDYTGDAASIGKNLGDDWVEGKSTLPLILAQIRGTTQQAKLIREGLAIGDRAQLADVIQVLRETDALQASQQEAEHFAELAILALQSLPESEAKATMLGLARYSVSRDS